SHSLGRVLTGASLHDALDQLETSLVLSRILHNSGHRLPTLVKPLHHTGTRSDNGGHVDDHCQLKPRASVKSSRVHPLRQFACSHFAISKFPVAAA
ncbi:hypothetical protein PF007_g31211, partial [Phytophthora fragariae]